MGNNGRYRGPRFPGILFAAEGTEVDPRRLQTRRLHAFSNGLQAAPPAERHSRFSRDTVPCDVQMKPFRILLTSRRMVVVSLCIFSLLLRFPLFFPDKIDWDESSLILMGQGILDGFLPYDIIWQFKPPLSFAMFATVIGIFGKTVIGIRFAGYLCVILTSYLVYRASYSISQKTASAAVAAFVSTTVISAFEPAFMTEVLCLVPLSGALLLLFSEEIKPTRALLVGLLMGAAVMISYKFSCSSVGRRSICYFLSVAVPVQPPFSKSVRLCGGSCAYNWRHYHAISYRWSISVVG